MPVSQPTDSKPFWQSKTFWVNLVLGAGSFVPAINKYLSPEILAGVFTVVNIVLRFISKDKISIT